MHQNFLFNNVNDGLIALSRSLTRHGEEVGSRNGRVMEKTHVGITLVHPWQREILLDHRKPNLAAQIAETMWVLTGRDDMDFLTKYLPRALDYSDDGKVWRGAYGPRLRAWKTDGFENVVDQWAHALELLKADPLTRRAVIAIYDPTIDTEPGKDIPCNDFLMFTSRFGSLDLQVAVRSNDLMWGWSGINAFEWSALLEISANILGLRVGALHFSVASLHLYDQHWGKAEKIAVDLEPTGLKDSPRFQMPQGMQWEDLTDEWFQIERQIREGDRARAAVDVEEFPEPMLQSWLRVIQWWWTGKHGYLAPLEGTRLEYATHVSMQPPSRKEAEVDVAADVLLGTLHPAEKDPFLDPFTAHAVSTHDQKHAAYGDSWKRRGEMLGIMANIARKVDRLGGSSTDDETSADTAMDLMVYLAKYRAWIFDQKNGTTWSDSTSWVNRRIADTVAHLRLAVTDRGMLEQRLRDMFDELETMVTSSNPQKAALVDGMLSLAALLARHLWQQEQGDDYRGADHD